jgi:hypothetical protein
LSVLTILSIGVFILPVAVICTIFLVRNPGARQWAFGLISGCGLPCLWIALLNRDGPGDVCTSTNGVHSCTQEWDPRIWIAVGLGFVVLGVAATLVSHRRSRGRSAKF